MPSRFLITGCSSGGKSTLLAELAARGYHTVNEPGRRIVAKQRATGGTALPWIDPAEFARNALKMACEDIAATRDLSGPVFFDRGLIDAAVNLHHLHGTPLIKTLEGMPRYADPVFIVPSWPALFKQDTDRKHDFEAAVAEHDRICTALHALHYNVTYLPKTTVTQRADIVLNQVAAL